ncbi:MAG TPA: SMP-30/gluconolactonase/LRE family protein [Rubellimicrobium sp.]|nr:SMP-30/gluconolactonase/LRE family protein [Rubellimicrobium sp.]
MSIYETIDPRFRALIQPSARLDHLGTGLRWAEGPVWFPAHQALYLSDIPNDRMMRWTEGTGLTVFRSPAGYTNGHTRDRDGRLVSCSHGARAVMRTEHDGSISTLASGFRGRRLNSPNDVVVARDGAVWFTDPTYGILSDYEGYEAVPEQDATAVYRIPPEGGEPERMAAGFVQPNGLAFSPDERLLYVVESGSSHDEAVRRVIRVFDVERSRLADGRDVVELEFGVPDGLRVDARGHVWCSGGEAVHVFHPDGQLLGRIHVPEGVANLCFGGPRGNKLFIAATTSVYAVHVNAKAPD